MATARLLIDKVVETEALDNDNRTALLVAEEGIRRRYHCWAYVEAVDVNEQSELVSVAVGGHRETVELPQREGMRK